MRFGVRIPSEAWMSVRCECCVLSGRGLCDGLITRPEEYYRLWCVVVCDLETSRMRRSWHNEGCCSKRKEKKGIKTFLCLQCVIFPKHVWLPHPYKVKTAFDRASEGHEAQWVPRMRISTCERVAHTYIHTDRITCWFWGILQTSNLQFVRCLQVFFVLRKKNNQISYLHLWHHTMMPICAWIGVKFLPGEFLRYNLHYLLTLQKTSMNIFT